MKIEPKQANAHGLIIGGVVLAIVWWLGGFNPENMPDISRWVPSLPSVAPLVPGTLAHKIHAGFLAGPEKTQGYPEPGEVTRKQMAEFWGELLSSMASNIEADGKSAEPKIVSDNDFQMVRQLCCHIDSSRSPAMSGAYPQVAAALNDHFMSAFGEDFAPGAWTAERRAKMVGLLRDAGEAMAQAARKL